MCSFCRTALSLLLGFSVYASITGGHSSAQAAARALADTTEQLKYALSLYSLCLDFQEHFSLFLAVPEPSQLLMLFDIDIMRRRAAIAPAIQEVNASACSLARADYKGHIVLLDKHRTSAEACWKACRLGWCHPEQDDSSGVSVLRLLWLSPFSSAFAADVLIEAARDCVQPYLTAHLGHCLLSADGFCRHKDSCTAWIWCAEESGCIDDRGQEIPFRGCQLKNEPMQAWGLPSASMAETMKVANLYSGYIKREEPLLTCTAHFACMQGTWQNGLSRLGRRTQLAMMACIACPAPMAVWQR